MDILTINSLIVLNSLNSVMVSCELYRRNFDSERCPYCITELLLLQLLRQLIASTAALHIWSAVAKSISVAVVLS